MNLLYSISKRVWILKFTNRQIKEVEAKLQNIIIKIIYYSPLKQLNKELMIILIFAYAIKKQLNYEF